MEQRTDLLWWIYEARSGRKLGELRAVTYKEARHVAAVRYGVHEEELNLLRVDEEKANGS